MALTDSPGYADVRGHFVDLVGREPRESELEELVPMWATHSWDAIDARIVAIGQRAPARSHPDDEDAAPATGLPTWLLLVVAIVVLYFVLRK